MSDKSEEENDLPVADCQPKAPRKSGAAANKWGAKVIALGFCMLPSLLLRAQRRLGLSPTQLAVLIQLADFWWDAGRKPFPKKADLALRLNLSERQVQRYIAELEEAGFVRRIERRASHRGKISNEYDLQGLVDKLAEIEPDFSDAAQEARAKRQAVSRPGMRRRRPAPTAAEAEA
ncbi:helix-turn-helix domain-containing protein [Sphingomonas carotinifaciens]|uniref:Helix-turn-helix domain-containing protein n=1 Tax=Sphingomonas carotinifaciens TaxID=1166323 RepID=A0A1G7PT00_9SPHN|nr:helix-turn-helix domain-containing protein [Sphingomonas carotinifaciens]MBB4087494.1 putative transcriptional regulator [Sphingomonas carotinifaciens]MWC45582.1 winged helix-turn-helix transcriptional regulator [Sphingomonas carotinifaciens]SDF89462.1 Helix-turn-helix domain-containing protein [Sphingomonas carotinifaciens]